MGTSTNAVLAYGYNLYDEGWQIQEADEWGGLNVPWYDEDEDDLATAVEKKLLADLAGFTETDWRADGYFERERAAKARLGVELEMHCSHECPAYLLAVSPSITTVHRGDCEELDPIDLVRRPDAENWNARLDTALRALGLTPKQKQPKWLLVSYWG